MDNKFKFEISLSVLNHLGRNLYRNIITIIAEAISNSWDADANNVWIYLNKDKNMLIIRDDGIGMNADDFQNKFLKIGYSKRSTGRHKSLKYNRPYIGRKGIGKLALLSCAEDIEILSKKINCEIIGGIINNPKLDEAIKDDVNASQYNLNNYKKEDIKYFNDMKNGTTIIFKNLNERIYHTENYLKKLIVLYFNFSIYDKNFNIYFNNELLDEKQLLDLSNNTQFIWLFNSYRDSYIKSLNNLQHTVINYKNIDKSIKGYIATTNKPSNLKISGLDERVTIDLFVNGRLREKDILKHIPTTRVVESYMYGRIYVDSFDDGKTDDIFTSNRETVKGDADIFNDFLGKLKIIINKIIDEWDVLRRGINEQGDDDNDSISRKERKAIELFNTSISDDFISKRLLKQSKHLNFWVDEIRKEASFNIPSYSDCFLSENLLRKYIKNKKVMLSEKARLEISEYRDRSKKSANKANISFGIRQNDNDLLYLDMDGLANLIDKHSDRTIASLGRSAEEYKPIRDALCHTAMLTNNAKNKLNTVYENIKARILELLSNL